MQVRNLRILSLLLLFCPLVASAWETDNVTCAMRTIGDSTEAVNAETNRRMSEALTIMRQITPERIRSHQDFRAGVAIQKGRSPRPSGATSSGPASMQLKNSEDPVDSFLMSLTDDELGAMSGGCSETLLAKSMSAALAGSWSGNLETWAEDADIPKCDIPVRDSVFKVFTFFESPVARGAGINPVIKVNGVHMGIDKLSHFMTEGYDYWQSTKPHYDVREAMQIGIREEEGIYGWGTTGVKSYADMAANYQGFLFWKNLHEGSNPYFKCEGGNWRQVRNFDWRTFVDISFDESINCNEYKTATMNRKMQTEIKRRTQGTPYAAADGCPLVTRSCSELVAKIRPVEVLETIVHPRCLEAGRGQPASGTSGTTGQGGAKAGGR